MGADFVMPKSSQWCEKQPVLGPVFYHLWSGPNTESEFGQYYKLDEVYKGCECSEWLETCILGVWGHIVSTPSGAQGQSPCKLMPRMVSNGLETCVSTFFFVSHKLLTKNCPKLTCIYIYQESSTVLFLWSCIFFLNILNKKFAFWDI